MEDKIKIGISSCLLGNSVRWNAGHKLDRYLTNTLGQFVEYVPVCPEVEAGFGVPRESLRLVGDPENPRLVTYKSQTDRTDQMARWAKKRVRELEKEDLCGFIFKSDSPSSGMIRVKVYNAKGMPEKKGVGMFARAYMDYFPLIPAEDDGRLHDPAIRENFIERIFTLKRWRDIVAQSPSLGKLVDFHSRQKLLLLSHSQKHYRLMGKLVAEGKKIRLTELYDQYEQHLMAALTLKTTLKKNNNVLQHLMGYFKKQLTADEKQELLEVFGRYREGFLPLIVPLTLINHYVRKYDQPYLKMQTYLNPHPVELKLRTSV
ncbi:YbgA family protein [Thermodesulfobacteriota bacterium]